jgi:type II secretory pathway pseudopilin PulG
MKKNKKHESGRSMIEMVGVLSVMGLITAGAFVLIRSGLASQRRNRASAEVANIVATIRDVYSEAENLNALSTNYKIGTEFLDSLRITTTTPFGSKTTYSVIRDRSEYADFVVQMRGLEEEDCMALSQRTWSEAVDTSCDSGIVYLYFRK